MSEIRFMDVEEFVRKINDKGKNRDILFYTGENKRNKPYNDRSRGQWSCYKLLPEPNKLNEINDFLSTNFKYIDVLQLIFYIINSKDNTGPNAKSNDDKLTSSDKKLLLLLLLEGQAGNAKESPLVVRADASADRTDPNKCLYHYLEELGYKGIRFEYVPGRTFSYMQLCKLNKCYVANGLINEPELHAVLEHLASRDLVVCVNEKADLWKLSFNGCFRFLESCMGKSNI